MYLTRLFKCNQWEVQLWLTCLSQKKLLNAFFGFSELQKTSSCAVARLIQPISSFMAAAHLLLGATFQTDLYQAPRKLIFYVQQITM